MTAGYSRLWGRVCRVVHIDGGELVLLHAERRGVRVRWTRLKPEEITVGKEIPVVAALSPRESFTRWVEAPFASRHKALRVLPTLLDVQLPFDLEECFYTVLHLQRTPHGTTRLLTAGARLSDIRARAKAVADLGGDPVVLDHEGLALWTQSIEEIPPDPKETRTLRVVVFLGRDRVVISVGRGKDFISTHMIREIDAPQLRRILLAHCGLAGTAGGKGPTTESVHWFWAGPGAEDGERIGALVAAVGPEWQGDSTVHEEPALFMARALAVRALIHGALRCNLRAGSEAHPALVRHMVRARQWAVLLLLSTGLVLCGVTIAFKTAVLKRISYYEGVCEKMADRLAGFHVTARGEDAIAVVQRAVEARKKELSPFRAAFEPSLLDVLIRASHVGQHSGLRFDTFALAPDRVTITGVAPAYDSCRDLLAYLNERGYRVRLERKPLTPQGMIPFVISSGGSRDE
ncbi:MAG: hypothetical protein N2255_09950 [Kiritimatiellae bacterium]|nr:hypothetical protein [Kiritimatiellia bacterium]